MNNIKSPQEQVFWYLKRQEKPRILTNNIKVDVAVIGGGMAGLTAAQSFNKKGLKVALIERYFCGSGATGKSSGFITPDSELDLNNLKKKFGPESAKNLWNFVTSGVKLIEKNIKDYDIRCDYQVQDTLIVANDNTGFNEIKHEQETREQLGYGRTPFYTKDTISSVIGSRKYEGGVRYGETFGINAYAYCQALKNILQDSGVQIYEETPVTQVLSNQVKTIYDSSIQADYVVVCADYAMAQLGLLTSEIYHAQTFLMLSAPLSDNMVKKIFPQESLMVWDTDLIYQYYRVAGDNRLMLGGASLWYTYASQPHYNAQDMFKQLTNYFKKKFPEVTAHFEYMWPGLIGISKDIVPLAGRDKNNPSLYYVGAAAGLPWAAALGAYSAESLIDNRHDLDAFFSPYRSFTIGPTLQSIIGTRAAFALSNVKSLRF